MKDQPDVILMDIQMPVMDGLEATRRIRANAATAEIPVIALTALAMPGDRERCMQSGANAYISKPLRLRDLAEMIEAQLASQDPGNRRAVKASPSMPGTGDGPGPQQSQDRAAP
jgi:CheY-like chemotaxis protein